MILSVTVINIFSISLHVKINVYDSLLQKPNIGESRSKRQSTGHLITVLISEVLYQRTSHY